ncbi:hypothetical protein QOT17_018841 [Balamuthia mandrillaris]
MEEGKLFGALLTGVLKFNYEGNQAITPQLLKEQVFRNAEVSEEEIEEMFQRCTEFLKKCEYNNWQITQLESALQKSTFTPLQQEMLSKFWRANRAQILKTTRERVTWNNRLSKLSYRIDVKTKAKNVAEVNEPVALVELILDQPPSQQSVAEKKNTKTSAATVRFEMDREQLADVIAQIDCIQQHILRRT